MTDAHQQEEKKVLSKHDFYFETPLYELMKRDELEDHAFTQEVDAYSAQNGSETTYSVRTESIAHTGDQFWSSEDGGNIWTGFYLVTLKCKRKNNDTLRFVVFRSNEFVMKVGQWPSLADLQYAEIGKKYDKVLPEQDLQLLKKAIGLVAHGAGAGSFVYLRRIFENLVFETYTSNRSAVGISEADFKAKRMEDKIEVLREFLPSQLLEMKSIYKILGKGVHELTEEECLQYFAPLKLSIELVLDQKIEEKKKQDRDAAVKKQLQDIHQKLGEDDASKDKML